MGGETEVTEDRIDNDNDNQNDVRGDNNDEMADRPQDPIQPMNGSPGVGGNNTGLPGNGGNNAGLPGGGGNNTGLPGARGGNNGLLENDGDGLAGLEGTESESDDDDDDDDVDEGPINTVGSSSSTVGETSDPPPQEEAPLLPDNEQPHKPKRGSKEWRAERKQKKAEKAEAKKREKEDKKEKKKQEKEAKETEKAQKKEEKETEKAQKKEEKQKKKQERQEEKKAKKQKKKSDGEEGLDDVDMNVAGALVDSGLENREDDQPGVDPNRAFDTLKDLNALNATENEFKPKEGASDAEKDLLKLKGKVYKYRKERKLYKAVIHIKMMDEGKEPASEEKALQKKGGGKGPNRFSRFMNSSKVKGAGHLMDQAGQIAKITGGVTGVASYFDADFKASKTNSIAGMITSVVTGLNSIRGLIKKVATLIKGRKKLKIKDKIFLVIGLVSDLATAVSKAAGLAKAIETYVGRGEGLLAKAADKVATISGMVGQMGGLTAQLNSLYELKGKIDEADAIEEAQAIKAEEAMAKYPDGGGDFVQPALPDGGDPALGNDGEAPLPDDVVDNSDVDDHDVENSDNGPGNPLTNVNEEVEEEEPELPPAGKKKTLRERIRARRLKRKEKKEEKKGKKEEKKGKKEEEKKKKEEKKKEKKKKPGEGGSLQRKQFVKRAARFVQREDVSDEDKEPVMLFLGFRRVRKKKMGMARIGLSNLVSTVLGLGSNAVKTASLYKPDESWLKDLSGKAGLASSVGLLGSSVANHFIKKSMGDKGDTGKQEETGMIKNRLYGMVKGIADDDKYGLRGAAAALESEPTPEKQVEVKSVLKRYKEVDKNLKGMGVDYDSLLQANNRDAFKDALIAGM